MEVELSTDKIIEDSHSVIKITKVLLGKEILEDCKITEVKIIEEDINLALGMTILEEIEVGLEKGGIQLTLGGMIEVGVDQDQVQE